MPIKNIQMTSTGLVGIYPRWIYIDTTDTLATISTSGYLNNAKETFDFDFTNKDMAVVSGSDGNNIFDVTVIGDNVDLTYNSIETAGSSTDDAVVRWNGTSGGLIQNSGVIVDDSDNMSGVLEMSATTITLDSGVTSINATEINLLDGLTAKSGSDPTMMTGTAGAVNELAMFNADGDVVTSSTTIGEIPVVGVMAVTIPLPTNAEDHGLFKAPTGITVTQLSAVSVGTTPSTTYTIRFNSDRSAAGTEVVTGGSTSTSTTTGDDVTVFNSAAIAADDWVWIETTALTGTVTQITITIWYTIG